MHSKSIDGDAVTVLLPPRGGYGDWLSEKTHMSQSFIKIDPTSATESTTNIPQVHNAFQCHLTTQQDAHYQIHNLELEGTSVQLEGKDLLGPKQ